MLKTHHGQSNAETLLGIRFAAKGRLVAPTAKHRSKSGRPELYDLVSRQPIALLANAMEINTPASDLSPDGRLLAWNDQRGKIHVRDLLTGMPLLRFQFGKSRISTVRFSPDSRTLAVAGQDGSIGLWDMAANKPLGTLSRHRGAVACLSFTIDGKKLASGSADCTVLLWDVAALPQVKISVPKDLKQLWTDLADKDVTRAYRAVWAMSATPDNAAAMLKKRIGVVPKSPSPRISKLISDMGTKNFAVRTSASRELENLGLSAETALRLALQEKPTLEVERRLKQLLARIVANDRLAADDLRRLRGLQVLELIGTTTARDVLKDLADGGPCRFTAEAQAALDRVMLRLGQ